jgi:hypothetical protein
MAGALHRVGQFWRHASARVGPDESLKAQRILGPELTPLFGELPVNDQRHGLDVLETVTRIERDPTRLLEQAALLHDVGKAGVRFSVIDRSLPVFLQALSPRLFAERLRAAGAADLAVIVAEHHAKDPQSEVTRRLQRADGRN